MKWLTVVLCLAAHAQAQAFEVDPHSCERVPQNLVLASASYVGQDWHNYSKFMCVYRVKSKDFKTVLFVLALDTDAAETAGSLVFRGGKAIPNDDSGGDFDPIPAPAVMNLSGNILGELPHMLSYPSLGFGSVSIYFSHWRGDFPDEFRLYVDDPTVTSPGWPYCPPAFVWNAKVGRYIEGKGDFYAKCR